MSVSAILGIDAAWTEHHPSGVALGVREGSAWRCVAAASSYAEFVGTPPASAEGAHDWPGAEQLLEAARRHLPASAEIDVVAVDMPLSLRPIHSRRTAQKRSSPPA